MEEKKGLRKKLICDTVLALCLLAFAIALLLAFNSSESDGELVRVTLNGDVVAEYSLSLNAEYVLNGGTNILVIVDGEAYIKSADCPDKICVNSGKIHLSGERIVCLPNKLMVEIIGKRDADFVS